MLHVVLVEPEIPANTGNIARTCAATGSVLHLIRPLGFDISDKAVKRAGLDYWHLVEIRVYENLDGAYLFFGKETKGLPEDFLARHYASCVRIPILAQARSLNLSNSVAVGVFEALRQQGFPHLCGQGKMTGWAHGGQANDSTKEELL